MGFSQDPTNVRILIVEDDAIIAEDLKSMIEGHGFMVHGPASTGAAALRMVEEHHPDLVLTDIVLKGPMDGIEIAQTIQKSHGIPVVFVTGYVDDGRVQRAKTVHPYGFVIKPFDERNIRVSIEMALFAAQADRRRRAAEEALRISEERYRGVFDNAAVSIALADIQGNWLESNPAFSRLLGYSQDELKRLTILDVTHPDHGQETQRYLNGLKNGEIPFYGTEKKYVRRDGTPVWMNLVVSPLRSLEGETVAFIGVGTDITEQKKATEEGRRSEEKYRTILEHMEEGYYEVDLTGNFVFCNEAMCRILGYEARDLIGMNNRAYMTQATSKTVFDTFHQVFLTGEPAKAMDWPLMHKDGALRIIETAVFLVNDPDGRPAGFRGLCRDVTARKAAEAERKNMVQELTQALSEVKTLRGLIAICSGCKKIRTDEGFWQQMELYIQAHSEAIFSHGLCPDCAKKLYPGYFPDD